jgi:hypothetical protein
MRARARGVAACDDEVHVSEAARERGCRAQKFLLPFERLDLSEHPDEPPPRRDPRALTKHLAAGRTFSLLEVFQVDAVCHHADLVRGEECLRGKRVCDCLGDGDDARNP